VGPRRFRRVLIQNSKQIRISKFEKVQVVSSSNLKIVRIPNFRVSDFSLDLQSQHCALEQWAEINRLGAGSDPHRVDQLAPFEIADR